MQHSFDIHIAEKFGLVEAILLNNLYFWIEKNRANDTNYFDGNYWTYNSVKAFKELFPYLTDGKIDRALKHLIEDGVLITGNYNKSAYDRTLWYALTDFGKSIFQNREMETNEIKNGNTENVKPIPYINPNINPNINKDRNRFQRPTLEEVKSYCRERNNRVDPQMFIDFYESKGWMVGKNPMKDWKACVRTWEQSDKQRTTVNNPSKILDERPDSADDYADWYKIELSK